MKKILNQNDIELVEAQIKKFEDATGSDLLLIITDSSDPYPAAAWRFGFISTTIVSFVFAYYIEFTHPLLWPLFFSVLMIIMTLIGKCSWAKRLVLAFWEVERECKEKAIELFHTYGTSRVTHQVTAMIMISLFEKEIEVLVDKKLSEKITNEDLEKIVHKMREEFKQGNFTTGLVESMNILEDKILNRFQGKVCDQTDLELHNSIIFLDGDN